METYNGMKELICNIQVNMDGSSESHVRIRHMLDTSIFLRIYWRV